MRHPPGPLELCLDLKQFRLKPLKSLDLSELTTIPIITIIGRVGSGPLRAGVRSIATAAGGRSESLPHLRTRRFYTLQYNEVNDR